MKKTITSLILCGIFYSLAACGFADSQEKENAAIKSVQQSESTFPGVDTTKAIAGLLAIMENRGRYVKIDGWSCTKNLEDSSYDVWFSVHINDVESKYHWVIKDNEIIPANDLAQAVTKRTRAI